MKDGVAFAGNPVLSLRRRIYFQSLQADSALSATSACMSSAFVRVGGRNKRNARGDVLATGPCVELTSDGQC